MGIPSVSPTTSNVGNAAAQQQHSPQHQQSACQILQCLPVMGLCCRADFSVPLNHTEGPLFWGTPRQTPAVLATEVSSERRRIQAYTDGEHQIQLSRPTVAARRRLEVDLTQKPQRFAFSKTHPLLRSRAQAATKGGSVGPLLDEGPSKGCNCAGPTFLLGSKNSQQVQKCPSRSGETASGKHRAPRKCPTLAFFAESHAMHGDKQKRTNMSVPRPQTGSFLLLSLYAKPLGGYLKQRANDPCEVLSIFKLFWVMDTVNLGQSNLLYVRALGLFPHVLPKLITNYQYRGPFEIDVQGRLVETSTIWYLRKRQPASQILVGKLRCILLLEEGNIVAWAATYMSN